MKEVIGREEKRTDRINVKFEFDRPEFLRNFGDIKQHQSA